MLTRDIKVAQANADRTDYRDSSRLQKRAQVKILMNGIDLLVSLEDEHED